MKSALSVSFMLLVLFSCSKSEEQKPAILKVDISYCIYPTDVLTCTGNISQSDTSKTYYAIWKDQFISRNQMSQDYFNGHITPCKTQLVNWVDGISFEISYKVKMDWAEAIITDKFAIWLSKTTLGLYPAISAPRNVLLTGDQISKLFSVRAFNSYINSVGSVNQLKYSSMQQAMSALINASGVDTLCTGSVFFQTPNLTSPPAGNPFIEASGVLNWNDNKCITSSLDLVTGEANVFLNACIYTRK
jgi:hypothetical protein